jgi:hypothetical protein
MVLRFASTSPRRRREGGDALFRGHVNPILQKYSTLPKFGNGVCVVHPGSSLRGDLVVVTFASRACGGRSSVVRERCGQGGLLSVSPRLRADERRCQVRLVCKFPAPSTGLGKLRRNGEPCVRQNRVVLAVVATVKPLRMRHLCQPARCRRLLRGEGGQRELGSRESTA